MARSLANRLTFRIMAVVLVMMSVVTGAVYYTVREYMLEEAQERYVSILLRNLEELRRRLSDVFVATQNNVHVIEQVVDDPERVSIHLNRIVRTNNSLVTSGVLYKPGYFPQRTHCLEIYASRDTSGVVHASSIENEHNIYMDWAWFKHGMSKDTADWSEVYIETNDLLHNGQQRQLTTYYVPLHNRQGQPVALLCSDLSLEFLRREFMEDIQDVNKRFEKGSRHHSYCVVVDRNGRYIMHPNEHRMQGTNFFDELRHNGGRAADSVLVNMMEGKDGSAMLEIDGVHSWVYYRTVKNVGWTIAIIAPEEVIFQNGRILNTIILGIVVLGIVVIYLICRRMITDTTTPVTAQQAAIEHELKIANGIQMAMLPKTYPPPYPERTDIDIAASETPAREVGGDLYDYFLRDNRLFFCIGDVSGKGMPAALLMAVMRTMFRSETRRSESAATIIDTMNHNLCEENAADYFVTMFVGILDLSTGHLDYCNAGHEAPLLIRQAGDSQPSVGPTVQQLPIIRNLPVGMLPDWNYEGQQTQLQPDDMLFLYTDGLSEAKNREGKRLGRAQVVQLARRYTDTTARQLVEGMRDEVRHFAIHAEQNDDITLMAIKRMASDSLTLQASMDDIGRLQPFMERVARQAGISEKESKRLRLAVEEAVANVINYGQATQVTLRAAQADSQLSITIDDDGQPFDPTRSSGTDLSVSPDQRPPGGMGIILLQKMTDSLSYQRLDGHNVLTLRKRVK